MDNSSKVTDTVILAGSIDPAMERTARYQYPADWPVISWMLPPCWWSPTGRYAH